MTLIRKHYGPPLPFHLCSCEWAKIYASNWHYNSHGIKKMLFNHLIYSLFLSLLCSSSSNVNVPPFSAYKTHTTCSSLHYLKFACTIFMDKNLPVPRSLFYSSHLVTINHTHSLNMNHLYFLHFPNIFNHFRNSIFLFFVNTALFFEVIFF